MDVEGRAPLARGQPLQLPPARIVLEEARAARADDADEVGDDGGRGLEAARARAFERDLANRVSLQHHRVEGAVDRCEGMRAIDECRLYADVHGVSGERRDPDEPDDHAELGGGGDVRRLELLDPTALDVLEADARAEGDRGEDGHLGGGVGTADVVGRIVLGVAELLRLRERLGVRAAALHAREHEVRRAVHDPEDAVHIGDDERLA